MKTVDFVAYGVKIQSNRELPVHLPDTGDVDQLIRLDYRENMQVDDSALPFRAPTVTMHNRSITLISSHPLDTNRKAVDRKWKLKIEGLFSFQWSNQHDRIQVSSIGDPDMKLLSFWLLHTVIPVYLMLKETSFFLHASAIEVDNQALLFLAPSFGGKSSLADYFVQQGYNIISDDKIRLQHRFDRYLAFPSHPYRRPFRQNEILGKLSDHFAECSRPVNVLYLLNLVQPECAFCINKIKGLNKFVLLKEAYLYEPASLTEKEIKNVLLMVQQCNMFSIDIPSGLEHLPATLKTILQHSRNLEHQA